MPRLLDSNARADLIVDAVCRLIVRGGLESVSLRAIAAETGVAQSTLSYHLSDRKRLLRVTAGLFVLRRVRTTSQRLHLHGVLAFLPADEDDLADTRVWLALCELGRTHPDVGQQIRWALAEEQDLLAYVLDVPNVHQELEGLEVLIQGLRDALCTVHEPMPLDTAREILRGYVDHAFGPLPDVVAQPVSPSR